mmetsp:Transcript_27045/g.63475  ORF Transcript_27045/g.63475 Transcript_27045/m.63475 type:complete len:306 (+) Transcript_27045:205-1122(+)
MMNEKGKRSDDKLSFLKNEKNALLNKFLTKTFHMIEQCDPSVASWSTDGKSFVIRDVDSFAKNVLPLYFKHSKFASFVRQLNFYSFRKLRASADDRSLVVERSSMVSRNSSKSSAVKFAHEHFRRGQPELLHKITRITKSQEPTSSEMKSLKEDIFSLKKDIVSLSNRFEHQLQEMSTALEADYEQRMRNIALSYQTLSSLSNQIRVAQSLSMNASERAKADLVSPIPDDKVGVASKTQTLITPDFAHRSKAITSAVHQTPQDVSKLTCINDEQTERTVSKNQFISPLMTLSGIATAMINNTLEQ